MVIRRSNRRGRDGTQVESGGDSGTGGVDKASGIGQAASGRRSGAGVRASLTEHLKALWKHRRFVLDELVLDIKLGEWNHAVSISDIEDEEKLFRCKIQEARQITATRSTTIGYLMREIPADRLLAACRHLAVRRRAKTLWYRNPRPDYK